jgi:type 1 glutamine amidotransferase
MNRWTTTARVGAAVLLLGSAGRAEAQVRKDAPGGTALFDGKTLNGWKQAGSAHFTVQPDGSLRAEGGKGALYAAKPYRDFALEVDFKVDNGSTDSGILLRADSTRADAGYQIQIRQEPAGGPYERYQRMTGAVDGIAAPTHLATKPVGEWNHYRIEVAGQRYRVWLNGELVNDYFGTRAREGLVGLESPDTTPAVSFRNVRLTPLSGGPERLGDAFTKGPKPVRVLVVTATHGFRHTEAIDASREVLPELARTTEFTFDFADTAGAINAANLARYDVLFLDNATLRGAPADTTAEARAAVRAGPRPPKDPLTLEQQRALDAWVRAGHGVALAHSGLDAMYGSASYREMVGGGLFEMHPWVEPVHVVVEDRANAAVRHFANPLWIRDEWYVLDHSPRATSHVLMSLDKASAGAPNMVAASQITPTSAASRADHPTSWVRKHGDGRVFATLLGHFGDVWHRPDFLQLLLTGLRIAAGTVPADFTAGTTAQ